jgi:alkanesulfonate monooxygenase SsuD/methylene tetrahydromethanopterin reductase-like flavin-dependent oxidoreductase (luciferase family)
MRGYCLVDFGISYFPTDEAVDPAELARMAEQRDFESVFVTEHTHIPANRETPYPAGGELPPEYSRTHDPFVALGTMAEATERIRIGTAICLLVERDPIITAKQVA